MNFLPVAMLLGKILYPSGMRVRVRVYTTYTRIPAGKTYPQK
jgi:hypothetical protein